MYQRIKIATIAAFLTVFNEVSNEYNWETADDGEIVGRPKNKRRPQYAVDPLTAVVNKFRRERHQTLLTDVPTYEAVKSSGVKIDPYAFSNLKKAIEGTQNRGYTPVLRGRLKAACGLKTTSGLNC